MHKSWKNNFIINKLNQKAISLVKKFDLMSSTLKPNKTASYRQNFLVSLKSYA